MGKRFTIKIEAILGGLPPSRNFSRDDQYSGGLGIDPDMPSTDSNVGPSGFLRPTSMAKFSASEITGVPLFALTSPKGTDTAVYANDGKVHIVDSTIAMGTALNAGAALSSAAGNGAGYYDNYWYFVKNADVARYGPLNGVAALTQNYWTSTLSLTAPTNNTYPSINGVAMPNHVMHRHTDDKNYFCDVTSGNQGILSYIKTSKTTVEGDTNSGSTFNALDFDYGYWPTTLETYGTDLAAALMEGTNTTIKQGRAVLAFWDTTSSSFYKIAQEEFPDPLITAMKNVNGVLWVWSGRATGGCRVSKFAGGYTMQEVAYFDDMYPPLQGAVDHELNRVVFGSAITYPETAGVVTAIGSKASALGVGAHNILKWSGSGANPWVTMLKYIQNASLTKPQPVIGWDDDSAKGLDKLSTTYGVSSFRSQTYRIGQQFKIRRIKIPLAQAIAANMTLIPTLYFDDQTTSTALRTINSTNFANSDKLIEYAPMLYGKQNFNLGLRWSGTALLTVALPIEIEVETKN